MYEMYAINIRLSSAAEERKKEEEKCANLLRNEVLFLSLYVPSLRRICMFGGRIHLSRFRPCPKRISEASPT